MFLHAKITNFVYFQLWVKFALLFPLLAELARFVPALSTHAHACLPYVLFFTFCIIFVLADTSGCFLLYFSSRLHVESLDTNSRGFSYSHTRVFAALLVLVKLPTFLSLHLFLCLLAASRCFYPVLPHVFVFKFVLL